MKAVFSLFAAAGIVFSLQAEGQKDFFFIQRNKNKNEVHYALRFDKKTCEPKGRNPIFGYWRNLEIGPHAYEPIGRFESLAYGISSQERNGKNYFIRLRAFPERLIRLHFEKGAKCQFTPYLSINGKESILTHIYVFAKEGLVKPTVLYVDIFGKLNGAQVSERVLR
ncbi:MAG: hypothetical protein LDLANPLL_00312 [Turneriella sp.]|nr:hypothetical protein [Turneriella sp.]